MKKLVLAIVAAAALTTPAMAQTVTCRTDAGRAVCHDVYGNVVTATRDALGNTTWSDQYGEEVTVRRDAMGATTTK